MNIANPTTIFYIALSALIVAVIALLLILKNHVRLKNVLCGQSKDLEGSIKEIRFLIDNLRTFQKETENYLKVLEKRVSRSLQSAEVVRFNPFALAGRNGNQSFSLAFLNEEGDGIVITGLYYSGDRVGVFTKNIKSFTSDIELTPEEKDAIIQAKGKLSLSRKS